MPKILKGEKPAKKQPLLPHLNVANAPTLTEFADDIRAKIAAQPAQVLRDDEKVRKQVAADADAILDKMSSFLA